MANGEVIRPDTEEEKTCFKVIEDLDVVSGRIEGSAVSKKHMRNEIWSLVVHRGAPSWYITLSPVDIKHPICLYFADTATEFRPDLRIASDKAYRLIAKNPVAGARFFHFMVSAFIKHVLGVGSEEPGLYGDTSAFYGSVSSKAV
ncbi:putative helitron helicase-like domain at N-terminus [Lyophyllum shimeji]|uniref:Helitron helicase-like domain at N-terminus n=1 Tax=Lyophyllum shimeji TaxID=47721 RepID=A0A9P3Q254_LYOSH|nr:putative helitron helicase-like domain at N-terminus [Lyophyllum shimeji]